MLPSLVYPQLLICIFVLPNSQIGHFFFLSSGPMNGPRVKKPSSERPSICSLLFLREEINLLPLHSRLLFDESTTLPLLPKCDQVIRLKIRNVISSHNFIHRVRCFLSMIEWNFRGVMMEHVSFDSTVHDEAADEAEVAIDG
jgi:hypothetical protein